MSTAFHIDKNGENLVCKNQDVPYNGVYLFINMRDVQKTALMMPPAIGASWISKYGSLTVSQISKEYPNGGINEAGLVVEQTTLWQTDYPPADSRPAINELQWIQFLLDTCSTVDEALQAAATVRIDQSTSKLHYLIADRQGDHAIIEFLNGAMTVHKELHTSPIMVNSLYEQTIAGRQTEYDNYERNSMDRFATVSNKINKMPNNVDTVDYAFQVLLEASREDTVFRLVYDIHKMEIHACSNQNQEIKCIKLDDFNFDPGSPSKAANLQLLNGGNIPSQFEVYNTALNYKVVHSFFRDPVLTSIFNWDIPDEIIHIIAHYPDTFNTVSRRKE